MKIKFLNNWPRFNRLWSFGLLNVWCGTIDITHGDLTVETCFHLGIVICNFGVEFAFTRHSPLATGVHP